MMTAFKSRPSGSIIITVLVSLLSGAIIQIAAGLIWGGKLITHVEQQDKEIDQLGKAMERLDTRGTQQLPIIDTRLKNLEETVHRNSIRIDSIAQLATTTDPVTQLQIDNIKQSIVRLEDVQRRVNDDLNGLYNQLRDGGAVKPRQR